MRKSFRYIDKVTYYGARKWTKFEFPFRNRCRSSKFEIDHRRSMSIIDVRCRSSTFDVDHRSSMSIMIIVHRHLMFDVDVDHRSSMPMITDELYNIIIDTRYGWVYFTDRVGPDRTVRSVSILVYFTDHRCARPRGLFQQESMAVYGLVLSKRFQQ